MSTPSALSIEELESLDEFLSSDAVPEDCMDISMLDGFLTALVLSPEPLSPQSWLDEIWGHKEEMVFESPAVAERMVDLILRHQQAIGEELASTELEFEPIFYQHEIEEESFLVVDEWCLGFVRGMAQQPAVWQRLQDRGEGDLLAPMHLFGTEEGWDRLDAADDEAAMHEEWTQRIVPSVQAIYAFWQQSCH